MQQQVVEIDKIQFLNIAGKEFHWLLCCVRLLHLSLGHWELSGEHVSAMMRTTERQSSLWVKFEQSEDSQSFKVGILTSGGVPIKKKKNSGPELGNSNSWVES